MHLGGATDWTLKSSRRRLKAVFSLIESWSHLFSSDYPVLKKPHFAPITVSRGFLKTGIAQKVVTVKLTNGRTPRQAAELSKSGSLKKPVFVNATRMTRWRM